MLLLQGGAQRAHNIIPVNIKDILDAADEKLKIEDTEAHMVFPFTLTSFFHMMYNRSFFRSHLWVRLNKLNQNKQMFHTL